MNFPGKSLLTVDSKLDIIYNCNETVRERTGSATDITPTVRGCTTLSRCSPDLGGAAGEQLNMLQGIPILAKGPMVLDLKHITVVPPNSKGEHHARSMACE